WISAGASGPERETIDKVAKVRGLPLIWPAMDAQDLATATALVSNHALEQLTASAARYRADGALFGMATRSGAGGSNAQFTFAFAGETGERQGSLEEGVHLAADRCAKSLTVSPNVRSDVRVRVGGIVNLDAYARTLNYLEGLTIVRAVAIDQLQADVLDIRVSVRGDAALLGKTIALDRRLTVDNSPNSDGALSFNYSP
ncbi:MAG: DUF2066 domain-containing protein, partial [Candidatus Obscuribacterales bacterium]|nr:DUF2066 domain-containing protein [Steroidobacteraceae bacterium]